LKSRQQDRQSAYHLGGENSEELVMRGSRPGERRGGRQKGTPNKKTAFVRAAMAAHAAQDNVSPLDLILAVMREPHCALDQRVKMALKALPHVHAKAKAGQPDDLSYNQAKPGNRSSAAAATKELMPLDFLQSVIRDAKTPPALQIKVAQAIIPYVQPKRSVRPKRPAIVSDRYGFAVDRELARKHYAINPGTGSNDHGTSCSSPLWCSML
jgi:hypothetical protein